MHCKETGEHVPTHSLLSIRPLLAGGNCRHDRYRSLETLFEGYVIVWGGRVRIYYVWWETIVL